MGKIPIAVAKRWREEVGATHLVVFAVDEDGSQHVATHGRTEADAAEAARAGNKLKAALGWPEGLCRAKPLERKCENCAYFERDPGRSYANCFKHAEEGDCLYGRPPTRTHQDRKCADFEPREA